MGQMILDAIIEPLKPRGWSGVIDAEWISDSFVAYVVGTGGSGPASLVIRVPPLLLAGVISLLGK